MRGTELDELVVTGSGAVTGSTVGLIKGVSFISLPSLDWLSGLVSSFDDEPVTLGSWTSGTDWFSFEGSWVSTLLSGSSENCSFVESLSDDDSEVMPVFESMLSEDSWVSSSVSMTDVSLLLVDVESSSELVFSRGELFSGDSSLVSVDSWVVVSSWESVESVEEFPSSWGSELDDWLESVFSVSDDFSSGEESLDSSESFISSLSVFSSTSSFSDSSTSSVSSISSVS